MQSDAAVIWLAVGAISLALMALLQLAAVAALLKVVMEALTTVRGVQAQVAPLIQSGQALVSKATDVVDQAQGVVAVAATQVKRVEGAVTMAVESVTDVRQGLVEMRSRASGVMAGVQTFWAIMRGRGRGGLRRSAHDEWDVEPGDAEHA